MISLVRRIATLVTDRIYELPVLVLMPHSRCNCRCVMCDIWKANYEKRELSDEDIRRHVEDFRTLGVRHIALSGGEALLHPNLWKLCDMLRSCNARISLLSTGLTLGKHAEQIVRYCDEVVVSLDGPAETHNRIRNIPGAFDKLAEGVRSLKEVSPAFRVTGRSVLQRENFRAFEDTVAAAHQLGLDQISFLGADVSSTAFNRPNPWEAEQVSTVALNTEEADELERIILDSHHRLRTQYDSKFIAESKEKLTAIAQHYRGLAGTGLFPEKRCNAPWVSAVIESNGDVMPCFFHPPFGNIKAGLFGNIINGPAAVQFRKELDVRTNPVCQRCVCSLYVAPHQP